MVVGVCKMGFGAWLLMDPWVWMCGCVDVCILTWVLGLYFDRSVGLYFDGVGMLVLVSI